MLISFLLLLRSYQNLRPKGLKDYGSLYYAEQILEAYLQLHTKGVTYQLHTEAYYT
jgi:hypothetical protein